MGRHLPGTRRCLPPPVGTAPAGRQIQYPAVRPVIPVIASVKDRFGEQSCIGDIGDETRQTLCLDAFSAAQFEHGKPTDQPPKTIAPGGNALSPSAPPRPAVR